MITISVNGDTSIENDETFTVMLDNAGSVPLGRSNGTITILNEE